MGGLNGQIRGKSKIEVYLKYKKQVEEWEELFEDQHPDPIFKKFCKSLMFQDQSTGEWVLNYHLHT